MIDDFLDTVGSKSDTGRTPYQEKYKKVHLE